MADSCHTPCKGRKASCTRPRCAASWLVPADHHAVGASHGRPLVLVKQSSFARAFRVAFLATLHPSTSVRVTIVPSSNLAEETRLRGSVLLVRRRHRQNFATTALGVGTLENARNTKGIFAKVQNPLMFNLKCGLIAASPARAATPAPRHSRAPAAIPRQYLSNIRAAVACAVVRRPSPAPVIRAVTQQHVALGRQHLGRGNRRSSSAESPQLLCTHRGCSQTMREAIWDMSWGWCAFTADVGVLRQGGAKCGDRLTCAAPARLAQHVAYAY